MCPSKSTNARNFGRVQSFVGLTEKERNRQLLRLDGAVAYRGGGAVAGAPALSPGPCSRCAARRKRLAELEQEFSALRSRLISEERVLRPAPTKGVLDLVQESAKLRITIDTLMRFQVGIAFPLCQHGLRLLRHMNIVNFLMHRTSGMESVPVFEATLRAH